MRPLPRGQNVLAEIRAELTGVRAMIEKFPLTKANEAYARMMSGKAEFRVVLTM